jgi:two-component system, LytTR family, sensor kinase
MRDETTARRRLMTMALIFACWTLYGLFFGGQAIAQQAYWGELITWKRDLLSWLVCGYVWAILTPPVLYLSERFRLDRRNWTRAILIHLPASILFAILLLLIYVAVTRFIGLPVKPKPYLLEFKNLFIVEFHLGLLTYWVILGIKHALDYYRKYRERELLASQLEARLAQAQLQVLKMQLHPHFLFNTLHAISSLMHRDVEAADRMIARLSDLLRVTLENAGEQEVSLKQELEMLERYLEIEQTRFQDRLTVEMQIEPETLDARVPNLILQPLVENAIKHGIAPRSRAGLVEIRATRENGTLQLRVRDDGKGLPTGTDASLKEGVGLANTRARLRQLYGSAHLFELVNAPEGGLVVHLSIPFRESEAKVNGEDSDVDRR